MSLTHMDERFVSMQQLSVTHGCHISLAKVQPHIGSRKYRGLNRFESEVASKTSN